MSLEVASAKSGGNKPPCPKPSCPGVDQVICLDDRCDESHHYKVCHNAKIDDVSGCEWRRSFDQKSIHVKQRPVKLLLKEGCFKKKADVIDVGVNLKGCKVGKNKVRVHVKKPNVHVAPQKIHVELVPGKQDCDKPVVRVHVNKPVVHVDKPEVSVIIDKAQDVCAPEPVITVTTCPRKNGGKKRKNQRAEPKSSKKPQRKVSSTEGSV